MRILAHAFVGALMVCVSVAAATTADARGRGGQYVYTPSYAYSPYYHYGPSYSYGPTYFGGGLRFQPLERFSIAGTQWTVAQFRGA